MGSKQAKWTPGEPARRPRSFTMLGANLEATDSIVGKPATRDASMQTGEESCAPMNVTPAGQLAGNPTDEQVSQEAPADVPQDTGVESVGRVMQEHPFESQDRASGGEMLATAEHVGGEIPQDLSPPQETSGGHHVAQIPQESAVMDNEKNARLEAQAEESS